MCVTKCHNCGEVTDVNHDCYIQPIKEDKEQNHADLRVIEEDSKAYEDSDSEEQGSRPSKLKPLLCFVDLECSLNEEKVFEVHRVGWAYEDDDTFLEADTVEHFLEYANSKTVVGEERQVVVVAHNMRGFDGIFIQGTLYEQGCSLEKILSQGAKMLSFE